MAKCKMCGKEIKWIRTTSGKSMPCDPQPLYYRYKLGAKDRIVTPNGEVLPCVYIKQHEDTARAQGYGFIPHFATCGKGGGK